MISASVMKELIKLRQHKLKTVVPGKLWKWKVIERTHNIKNSMEESNDVYID